MRSALARLPFKGVKNASGGRQPCGIEVDGVALLNANWLKKINGGFMCNLLWKSYLVLAAAISLSSPVVGQTTQGTGWQFRCPLPGASVQLSGGGSISFRGWDSSDPLVCLAGNDSRRFLNYWRPDTDLVKAGRREIETLFPANVGKQVSYQYATVDARTHASITIRATWLIASSGQIRVPAGTFDAIKIEHVRETVGGNWRQRDTIWLDRITGATIKVDIEFAGGVPLGGQRSWEATSIRAAPG